MTDRQILAETATPDGIHVVLFEDTWLLHILNPYNGHPELEPYLPVVLATVTQPNHREPDPRPSRERFFKQDVGPSKWLMVVVDSENEPPRIVTALGYGHGESPSGWTT
jgi:hypothetical protein